MDLLYILQIIIIAIWLMLPAYIPNPMAAVFGGGRPIDHGRYLQDGRRILGEGKTYRGLGAGILCGLLIGALQTALTSRNIAIQGVQLPSFGPDITGSLLVILALSIGALCGDMFMSFFKRRLGLRRGAPLPVIDQLDFVLGAWVLTYILATDWFIANFSTEIIIAVLVITPVLHVVTNIVGYLIGVKKEPW
ncbi:protein of unknown function DUF46 [Methanosalsum zhilinae DSM 4017]|uniref:CDP-archaeol synthase n=1 Tax=Methanosalsum zhilinae (strain DSM 4017 / NBRC 107636 / OCM 62 / WeN5) TaxID=679901 RepID=F7XQJ0_METZD|nr:CDP-2,3-bis-(O-geranylgeranyl)-sn-glycerol synthase [Methanosalsum zhilinae]AEH60492.1 protein of unknown function DUF46 [Methanosalsum zhilinae DSM 4017]